MKTFKGGIFPPEHKELCRGKNHAGFSDFQDVLCSRNDGRRAERADCGNRTESLARASHREKRGFRFRERPQSSERHCEKIVSNLSTANAEVPCIVIQADDEDRVEFMPPLDPFSCSGEEALSRVKDAGICGMGGASFPTHVKLNPPKDCKIDFILLNAAECEPYLTVDEQTLDETPEKVVDGLLIVQRIVASCNGREIGEINVRIVLESNKAHLVPKFEEAAKKARNENGVFIEIILVKTKYPQGAEKDIITAATGREVPAGKLLRMPAVWSAMSARSAPSARRSARESL